MKWAAAVAIVPMGVMGVWFISHGWWSPSTDPSVWGVFGDFVGGVTNAILAAFNLYAFLKVAEAVRHHENGRDTDNKAQEDARIKFAQDQEQRNRDLQMKLEAIRIRPALRMHYERFEHTFRLYLVNTGLGPAAIDPEQFECRRVGTDRRSKDIIDLLDGLTDLHEIVVNDFTIHGPPDTIGVGESVTLFACTYTPSVDPAVDPRLVLYRQLKDIVVNAPYSDLLGNRIGAAGGIITS